MHEPGPTELVSCGGPDALAAERGGIAEVDRDGVVSEVDPKLLDDIILCISKASDRQCVTTIGMWVSTSKIKKHQLRQGTGGRKLAVSGTSSQLSLVPPSKLDLFAIPNYTGTDRILSVSQIAIVHS